MAKDKQAEAEYKAEGKRRNDIRKKNRLKKYIESITKRKYRCRGCGEDPYCYYGDGTPYSY